MTPRRIPMRSLLLTTAVCLGVGMMPGAPACAAEQRQVVVQGRHLAFGGLPQLGAVTFLARSEESGGASGKVGGSGKGKGHGALPAQEPWWQRPLAMVTDGVAYANSGGGKGKGNSNTLFQILGDDASVDRVDGRNYNTSFVLTGSGNRPGVALDVAQSYLTTNRVTLAGSSPTIQDNIDPSMDVGSYVNFLAPRANATYTSNTTLNNQNIGGPANYQIVVVKDCTLTLKGTTTGYGILVVYDSLVTGGNARLVMQDTANWYGVILFYTGNSAGNAERFTIGQQNGGGGGGGGSWLPVQTPWWQRALAMLSGERPAYAGGGGAAGTGCRVLGAVIARAYQFTVQVPNKGVADIYYSSATINNIDNFLQGTKFLWENWRER